MHKNYFTVILLFAVTGYVEAQQTEPAQVPASSSGNAAGTASGAALDAAQAAADAAKAADAARKAAEAAAARAPQEYTAVSAANDFSGVRLSYPVRVYAKVHGTSDWVCIPAGFPLRGLGTLTEKGVPVKLRADNVEELNKSLNGRTACDNTDVPGTTVRVKPLATVIGSPLIVSKSDNDTYMASSNGLTYGLLVVPFKYHLRGSKEFKGGGSIGPYAGYKTQSSNWAAGIEIVGFAGLGAVEAPVERNGNVASDTLASFSYGLALIGRIKGNFQAGLVVGQDRVSKTSNYKDNGKWWLALSIGYPFSH